MQGHQNHNPFYLRVLDYSVVIWSYMVLEKLMLSKLITKALRTSSLEKKGRYNIVLVKRSTFAFYNKSVGTCYPCHLIQYIFVFPSVAPVAQRYLVTL